MMIWLLHNNNFSILMVINSSGVPHLTKLAMNVVQQNTFLRNATKRKLSLVEILTSTNFINDIDQHNIEMISPCRANTYLMPMQPMLNPTTQTIRKIPLIYKNPLTIILVFNFSKIK